MNHGLPILRKGEFHDSFVNREFGAMPSGLQQSNFDASRADFMFTVSDMHVQERNNIIHAVD